MTREEFAFNELEARTREDARFPTAPHPWSEEWEEYARMRRDRANRRKSMGYSRATVNALVQWARMQDA